MRRSRLSYPETSNPFSTSPKNPNINLTMTRKSILECNVNPYELMSANEHKLKQNPKQQNGINQNKQNGYKQMNGIEINEYENIEIKKTIDSKIPVKQKQQVKTRNRSVERENVSNDGSNKFKSILKKPSTFNDTHNLGMSISENQQKSLNSTKSGSHFYLPMPNASRKKVQFLEEKQHITTNQRNNTTTTTDISDTKTKYDNNAPNNAEFNQNESFSSEYEGKIFNFRFITLISINVKGRHKINARFD